MGAFSETHARKIKGDSEKSTEVIVWHLQGWGLYSFSRYYVDGSFRVRTKFEVFLNMIKNDKWCH